MTAFKAGLISDTHGVLPETIWPLFEDVDLIFHVGDVGNRNTLADLGKLAPVLAVQGNTDALLPELPEVVRTEIGGISVHMRHIRFAGAPGETDSSRIELFGHTHMAHMEKKHHRLIVNPGSASRSRSGPPTAGILTINKILVSVSLRDISSEYLDEVKVVRMRTAGLSTAHTGKG